MAVSYMANLEQLSVLAHFSGYDEFPGLLKLPVIGRERCEALLEDLSEQGMTRIQGDKASVDLGLSFVLSVMAKPELVIKAKNGAVGYCVKNLGVVVSKDSRSQSRYRITPTPTACEMAKRMWQAAGACFERCDFSLYRKGIGLKDAELTQTEMEKIIAQTYTEVTVD